MIIAGHQTSAVFVLDGADGRPVEVVDLADDGPTNACFGGPDFSTLYVTSSDMGRIVAIDWPRPGMRLHPDRG
jgi:gluconolactonase